MTVVYWYTGYSLETLQRLTPQSRLYPVREALRLMATADCYAFADDGDFRRFINLLRESLPEGFGIDTYDVPGMPGNGVIQLYTSAADELVMMRYQHVKGILHWQPGADDFFDITSTKIQKGGQL